jgi:hypothetical protein
MYSEVLGSNLGSEDRLSLLKFLLVLLSPSRQINHDNFLFKLFLIHNFSIVLPTDVKDSILKN